MKSQDEIVARIEETKEMPFNFTPDALLQTLDYEHAKPYLADGVTAEQWDASREETDPLKLARAYIDFAWGKALDHRGLSAGRSVQKIGAWLWAANSDLTDKYEATEYPMYGAPQLRLVCERYDWSWPSGDEAAVRMSEGRSCRDGCDEGCRA